MRNHSFKIKQNLGKKFLNALYVPPCSLVPLSHFTKDAPLGCITVVLSAIRHRLNTFWEQRSTQLAVQATVSTKEKAKSIQFLRAGQRLPGSGPKSRHAAQTTRLPSHSSSSEYLDISLRSRRPATVSNRSCCNARCGVIFSFKQDNRPPGADSSSRGQCPPSKKTSKYPALVTACARRKWF